MDSPESEKFKDVRRPMNAFIIFCKRHRSIVRERNPHLDNRSVTRMLGELWAELGEEEKVVYTDLAKQYKDAFMKAHPDFKWHGSDKCSTAGLDSSKLMPTLNPPAVAKLFKVQTPSPAGDTIVPGKLADPTHMGGLNQLLMAGQQGSIATTSVTMTTNANTMMPASITGSPTCPKSSLLVSSPLGKKNISSFQYILPKEAGIASNLLENQVLSQALKLPETVESVPISSQGNLMTNTHTRPNESFVSQNTANTKIMENRVATQFDTHSISPSSKGHGQLSGPVLWSQFPITQTQSTNQQSDIDATKRLHLSPRIPGGQRLGRHDNSGHEVTAGMNQSGLLQLAETCSSELSQGSQPQLLSPKLSSSSSSSSPLSSSAKCHQLSSGLKTGKGSSSSSSSSPSINNRSHSKGPNRQANKLLYSLIAENPVDCYTFTGDEDEDDAPAKREKPFRHKVASSGGKIAHASFGGASDDVASYNDVRKKGSSKTFTTQQQNVPVISGTTASADARWSVDQTDRTLVTCGKMVVDHIIDRLFSRELASQGQKSFINQVPTSLNQNIEFANFCKMEKIEEVEAALKEKLGDLNHKYPKSIGDYVTRVISDAYSKVQHDVKNQKVSSTGNLSSSSTLISSSVDKPVSGPGRDKKLKALLQQCGSDNAIFTGEPALCTRSDDNNITALSHTPEPSIDSANVIYNNSFTKDHPIYRQCNAAKASSEAEKIQRIGEIKSRFRSCSESASDRCDVNSAMNIKMRPPKKRPYPAEFCSSEGDLSRLNYSVPLSQTDCSSVPSTLYVKDTPLACSSAFTHPGKETTHLSGRNRIHSESEIDSIYSSRHDVDLKNNLKIFSSFANVSNISDPDPCDDGNDHDLTTYPNTNKYEHATSLDKRHFMLDQAGNVLYDAFGTEPILKASTDRSVELTYSNVRKSKRRNRGQRYLELINEGIIQPSKERLAALKTGSVSDLEESDADDPLSDSYSSEKFKRYSPVTKATMLSNGDSLPDSVAIAMRNDKRYSTGDFDLEAHIAELPMCSLDSLSRKKRKSPQCGSVKVQSHDDKVDGKKIKLEPNADVSSNAASVTQSLPPRLPVKEATISAPLVGSNKRKARKYSITQLIQVTAFDSAPLKDETASDVDEKRVESIQNDVSRPQIPQIILPSSDSGNETDSKSLPIQDASHGAPLDKLIQCIPNYQNTCRKLFSSDRSVTAVECDAENKTSRSLESVKQRSNPTELPDCVFNPAVLENVLGTDCDNVLEKSYENSDTITQATTIYVRADSEGHAKGGNQGRVYDSSLSFEGQMEICNSYVDKASYKMDSLGKTGQGWNIMGVNNNNGVCEKAGSNPASSTIVESRDSVQSSQSNTELINPHSSSQGDNGDNFRNFSDVCNMKESKLEIFYEKTKSDCLASAGNSNNATSQSRPGHKGDNCVLNRSLTATCDTSSNIPVRSDIALKSDIPVKSDNPAKSDISVKSDIPVKSDNPVKSDISLKSDIRVKDTTPVDEATVTLNEKGDSLLIGCNDLRNCEFDISKYSDQNTFTGKGNVSNTPDQNLKAGDASSCTSNLNTESLIVDITMTTTADDSGLGSISDDSGLSNNDEKPSGLMSKDDEIFRNYDEKDGKSDKMEIWSDCDNKAEISRDVKMGDNCGSVDGKFVLASKRIDEISTVQMISSTVNMNGSTNS